jgi:glutamate synthase domain-containing protein 3
MAAFMMQKGRLIVCGDAGDGLADSMYEGIVFVGGKVASPGNDTVEDDPTPTEAEEIAALLDAHGVRAPARFRKLVSGRKLWNFDRKELAVWRAAL